MCEFNFASLFSTRDVKTKYLDLSIEGDMSTHWKKTTDFPTTCELIYTLKHTAHMLNSLPWN